MENMLLISCVCLQQSFVLFDSIYALVSYAKKWRGKVDHLLSAVDSCALLLIPFTIRIRCCTMYSSIL